MILHLEDSARHWLLLKVQPRLPRMSSWPVSALMHFQEHIHTRQKHQSPMGKTSPPKSHHLAETALPFCQLLLCARRYQIRVSCELVLEAHRNGNSNYPSGFLNQPHLWMWHEFLPGLHTPWELVFLPL